MRMRIVTFGLVAALAACAAPARVSAPAPQSAADGVVTVHLSNFAFDPAQLRLKKDVPVRLRLVNDSDGGHDFSAPGLFAASTLPPGVPAPPNGAIDVGANQTVEIALVPHTAGTYPLECTHFLHSAFGMTGSIEVVP